MSTQYYGKVIGTDTDEHMDTTGTASTTDSGTAGTTTTTIVRLNNNIIQI